MRSACLWAPEGPSRPGLLSDREADVAIVGAGFTGLWTAYYLAQAEPSLSIVVLEAENVGFGASGRNGGWCSALFPASLDTLAALPGSSREMALAQHEAMKGSVAEVVRVAAAEAIDADVAVGGTVVLARSRMQWRRARAQVEHARSWGLGEDDVRLLERKEARAILDGAATVGATFTPHCAAVHPGRLVRGLAVATERAGVEIFERTRVRRIEPRRVVTERAVVSARWVIRATEGYTPTLAGQRRAVMPVYSLIIASEPLPEVVWEQIGLRRRETFSDHRHLIVYGQRTADDRLVFGGRGAPYHWGSRIRPEFDRDDRVFAGLHKAVIDLFPVLRGVRFTHAWGGPLGIARDWCASVGLDPTSGVGWAGGYVGDGVSTTNLAGRTLRDLILGDDTALTRLPWVGHLSPKWEPEPLRWAGANAGLQAMTFADTEERLTGRPSLVARAMAPFVGGH